MVNSKTNKQIIIEKPKSKRKNIINYEKKNNDILLTLNDYNEDCDKLRKIYMNINFDHDILYKNRIQEKINSYINQDKKKYRNTENNIIFEEVVEKSLTCKLKCYYCKCRLCFINENIRQKNMWTLDRIDNNLSHTNENTCVSCLQCNLQKRRRSHEKFKFTKQMIIKKQGDNNENNK